MPDPIITVALPLFRARDIAWFALESLCRQEDAPPWELIIVEEQYPWAINDSLTVVRDRLRAANCRRIHYIPLDAWLPLSLKWRMAAHAASESSKYFLLAAADCWSPKHRLSRTGMLMDCIRSDALYHWVQAGSWLMYHVGMNQAHRQVLGYNPCGDMMACLTDDARQLPEDRFVRGIDTWFFLSLYRQRPEFHTCSHPDLGEGAVNVRGFNNLSGFKLDDKCYATPVDVSKVRDALPDDVWERLQGMRNIEAPPLIQDIGFEPDRPESAAVIAAMDEAVQNHPERYGKVRDGHYVAF